jgi:hypothetical protein
MQAQTDLFDGAISYVDELPMEWLPAASLPENDALRQAESNLRLLGTIAQLEERAVLSDDPAPQELETARLHAKVDALITIVGAVLTRFVRLPQARPVQLSWAGVVWPATAPLPAVGDTGLIEIYLHPALPKPLRFKARVVRTEGVRIRADFLDLPPPCQQALERQVFLRHRRAVAERRNLERRS